MSISGNHNKKTNDDKYPELRVEEYEIDEDREWESHKIPKRDNCQPRGKDDALGTMWHFRDVCAQVLGISHLSRDLKNCDEFIACGREGMPLEMHHQEPAAVTTRRRAATPYNAPALQGINNNPYNRIKKGFTRHVTRYLTRALNV